MDTTKTLEMPKIETSPLMSVEIPEIIPCEEPTMRIRIWSHVKHNLLLFLTIFGVTVGFGIGFGVRPSNPSDTVLMWIGKPNSDILYVSVI